MDRIVIQLIDLIAACGLLELEDFKFCLRGFLTISMGSLMVAQIFGVIA